MRRERLSPTIPFLFSAALLAMVGCASVLGIQKGGFNLISLDQEWAMRDDLKQQVATQYRLESDASAVAYLNQVGLRLVAQTDLRDRQWEFGIVDDASVNAFNLPGGLVYVHKGLLKEADRLNQLTAVLGHEIGHGAARHGTQLMTRAVGVDVLTGIVLGKDPSGSKKVLGDLVSGGILMNYSRDAEREADRLGIGYNHAAGYDPNGAVIFFRKLVAMRQRTPSKLERFFSSHPVTEERIANAEASIRLLPPVRAPVEDTADYQALRRRLGVAN